MLHIVIKLVVLIGTRVISGLCFLLSTPYYFQNKKKCSFINNKILFYPARILVKMIATKQISCQDVIHAYISRIKEVNPLLNAVVENKFEEAIAKARDIDELVTTSGMSTKELLDKYPLLGLPLTIKESIALKGASYTAGKVFEGGRIATSDATIVKLCKTSGAVPLLVSNTPELSANFETYNNVTGRTCNPYDHRRTCGGSSGGEGALLGAGASLIGLGSDIFGSLRLPAHYCGIWGHKPSPFTVAIDGHFPMCKDVLAWKAVFSLGAMTRYAGDLPLILEVISEKKLQFNTPVDISSIKFYHTDFNESILYRKLDKETCKVVRKLINYLSTAYPGNVSHMNFDGFKYTPELCVIKMFNFDDVEEVFENKGKLWFKKLLLHATRKSTTSFAVIMLDLLKRIHSAFVSNNTFNNYDNILNKLRKDIIEILGTNGVLLYPSHPTSAPFHGTLFGHILEHCVMGIFNCLGFPVTNCVLGLNSQGLPVGIQVITTANNDHLSLAVAQEIEKAFGGWVPP